MAFGIGLFSGTGSLGVGAHRAFSVISESRANDIWLRFYKNCQTYNVRTISFKYTSNIHLKVISNFIDSVSKGTKISSYFQ